MIDISKHGIEVVPLTPDRLELVRLWRNSEQVRRFMEFQEEITPDMQREWFDSINNEDNTYSVIVHNGREVGLANVKNIDRDSKRGEAGIFIADPDSLNSPLPILVSLYGLDYCFEQLGLEELYGKTAEDNRNAMRMNAAFGYEPVGEAEGRFRYYRLTRDSYYEHREHLIDLLYGTE